MQHSNKNFHIRTGFTLFELLIVLFIVSTLVLWLVVSGPSPRAHQTARAMQCATNMRSIGQAMWGYTEEHQGRFPGQSRAKGYPNGVMYSWQFALNHEYFGDEFVDVTNDFDFAKANSGTIRWMHSPDIPWNGEQLWCPSIEETVAADVRAYRYNINLAGGRGNGNQYGQEIKLTGELATRFKRYHLGTRTEDVDDQSKNVLIIESNTNSDHFDYLPSDLHSTPLWTNQWSFRHNDSSIVLFADGHVARIAQSESKTILNEQAVRLFGE